MEIVVRIVTGVLVVERYRMVKEGEIGDID